MSLLTASPLTGSPWISLTLSYGPGILRDERIDDKERDSLHGPLCHRIAAGLAPLMHLQLRVLEKKDFEKRLRKLERLVREGIMENRKGSAAEERP